MILQDVDRLVHDSAGRLRRIKEWYNLIRLENNLQQDDMESVISPDPRSSFNMAAWLLKPKIWRVRIDAEGFTADEVRLAAGLEGAINRELLWQDKKSRGTLFGSPIERMIKLALSTGWFTFATLPNEPHWMLNVLHPSTVFPQYNVDGKLVRVARKYTVPYEHAAYLAADNGWTRISTPSRRNMVVRSLWVDNFGEILHGVSIGNEEVRPLSLTFLPSVPLYCYPVGGLPDDGSIVDNKWMEEVGQSLVSGVMELQYNINKMQTYMQQILRDTANSMIVTRTQSGEGPITPENRFKRGNVFDLQIGEDVTMIAPPPLPPDMRTHGIDMRNQAQRALFPDVSFGNFSQSVSVFLMTQATAGTQQVLNSFQNGLRDAMGIISTQNVNFLHNQGMPVLGQNVNGLPQDLLIDFVYDIVIPGDFVNRINSARMANPEFTLSQQTIIDTLIPEVRNYAAEEQRKSTDRAVRTDMFRLIEAMMKFREAAADARNFNDIQAEAWFTSALQNIESQLRGAQGNPPEGLGAFDQLSQLAGQP